MSETTTITKDQTLKNRIQNLLVKLKPKEYKKITTLEKFLKMKRNAIRLDKKTIQVNV